MHDSIIVKGAREHNLKNVSVTLPRNRMIVFTGLSGSGKSSLAFDTIYAEGQRRYVESMSSYARQFLGQMDKPDVDLIEGLSPAISIDQKTTARNPRSTVGTVTEIHDYLRLLYARAGTPHCPVCGREIRQQSVDEMVAAVLALPEGTKIQLLSPVPAKASIPSCWSRRSRTAFCACASTAKCTSWTKRPSWISRKSTPSRSWWIAWWCVPISASA